MTHLYEQPEAPAGDVDVAVQLEGLSTTAAIGVVFRPPSNELTVVEWIPKTEYAATTQLIDTADTQGRRLVLLASGVTPTEAGEVALGTLRFANAAASFSLTSLPISYEDVYPLGLGIESSKGQQDIAMTSPLATQLHANQPNPFNPMTTIRFDLAHSGWMSLRIYDVAGRLVRTLVHEERQAGFNHSAVWDGRDDSGRRVATGVYLYRLETQKLSTGRKLVLVK